jgi:hypothetical protein
MGVGEAIFHHLLARREAQRQYRFDFMPPVRNEVPYTLTLDVGDAAVHVVAEEFGTQGLTLDSLRLTGPGGLPAVDGADGLMRLVERIVEVESPYGTIKCIENDERLTKAVLRTDPTEDGCFFEVVVDEGNIVELKHYTVAGASRERRPTPINLSRRVFVKMADGLAGAFRTEYAGHA